MTQLELLVTRKQSHPATRAIEGGPAKKRPKCYLDCGPPSVMEISAAVSLSLIRTSKDVPSVAIAIWLDARSMQALSLQDQIISLSRRPK